MAAVLREVYEETAQSVVLADLETVQTSHWVGRNPLGEVEDFHAVRLVYLAACPEPTEPQVLDAEGTTADARWVPLTRLVQPGLDRRLAPDPDRYGASGSEPIAAVSRCRSADPAGSARPTGLPSSSTSRASSSTSSPTAPATGSLAPSTGNGDSMTRSTASAGPALRPKRAPSSPRSLTEPTTSAAITGGSARTTGICDTPYSRRIDDRLGDRLVRVGVHQRRQLAGLLPQDVADHPHRGVGREANPYRVSQASLNTLVR